MGDQATSFALTITPSAVEKLRELLAAQPAGSALRIFVLTGAEPHPNMALERPRAHEEVLVISGIPVVVDSVSRKFLAEATVDYMTRKGAEGFHIDGPNVPVVSGAASADAHGAPAATPASKAKEAPSLGGVAPRSNAEREVLLRKAFRQIFDPEIPMNILDLGLIYGIDWPEEGSVRIRMTMTSPGCPVAGMLSDAVESAARGVPGVRQVEVAIVWEPPWGPEKMSDFAKRQFGYL